MKKQFFFLFLLVVVISQFVFAAISGIMSVQTGAYSLVNNSFINTTWAFINASYVNNPNESALIDFNRSLVVWLRFEDTGNFSNATDSSSWNNNASLNGFKCSGGYITDCNTSSIGKVPAGYSSNGARGNSIAFDDNYTYLQISKDNQVLNISRTRQLTVEIWVYPRGFTNHPSNQFRIAYSFIYPANGWYLAADNGGRISMSGYNGTQWQQAMPSGVPLNTWSHIVATMNDTNVSIYYNGIYNGSTKGYALNASTDYLNIGSTISGYGWNGSLDDFQMWNRVLSPVEIAASYNASKGLYANFSRLLQGNYSYYIAGINQTGNLSQTGNYTFSVDTAAPSISFTANTPASNSFVRSNYFFLNTSENDNGNDHNDYSAYVDFNRSLVGYWRFEDAGYANASDISTYANNGSMFNFACYTVNCNASSGFVSNGKRGKALVFDGQDDYFTVNTSSSLNLGKNWTREMWVKLNAGINGYGYIFSGGNQFEHGYELIVVNNSGLKIEILGQEGGGAYRQFGVTGSTSLNVGQWYHVATTYNNTKLQIYVNGNLDATSSDYGSYMTCSYTANNFGRGRDWGANIYDYNFSGAIDDVQFWNRPLSSQEINASYNAGVYRLSSNFTGLQDGNYSLKAYSVDAAGNINQTGEQNFTIDTTAPIPTVLSPINNANFTTSRVNVTFGASDLNFKNMTLRLYNNSGLINDSWFTTANASVNYSLVDGQYNASLTAYDQANNTAATANTTFNILTSAPIQLTNYNSDANGSYVPRNWIFVNWTASSASGVNGLNFTFNMTSYPCTSSDGNKTYVCSYNFTGLMDKKYSYTLNASNAVYSNTTNELSVIADTKMPTVVINSPSANNSVWTAKSGNYNFNVSCWNTYLYACGLGIFFSNGTQLFSDYTTGISGNWSINDTVYLPVSGVYTVVGNATTDISWSPETSLYADTDAFGSTQYKDADGDVFTVTPTATTQTLPGRLGRTTLNRMAAVSSMTEKADNDLLTSYDVTPLATITDSSFTMEITSDYPIVYRSEVSGIPAHFVIGDNYFWTASDIADEGLFLSVEQQDDNDYTITANPGAETWASIRTLDPRAGGLYKVSTNYALDYDSTSPTYFNLSVNATTPTAYQSIGVAVNVSDDYNLTSVTLQALSLSCSWFNTTSYLPGQGSSPINITMNFTFPAACGNIVPYQLYFKDWLGNTNKTTTLTLTGCIETWQCTGWVLNVTDNVEYRSCTDTNLCGTTFIVPPTSRVQNHNETFFAIFIFFSIITLIAAIWSEVSLLLLISGIGFVISAEFIFTQQVISPVLANDALAVILALLGLALGYAGGGAE